MAGQAMGYNSRDAAQGVKLSPVRRGTSLQSCGFLRLRRLHRGKSRTKALPRMGRLPERGGVAPANTKKRHGAHGWLLLAHSARRHEAVEAASPAVLAF